MLIHTSKLIVIRGIIAKLVVSITPFSVLIFIYLYLHCSSDCSPEELRFNLEKKIQRKLTLALLESKFFIDLYILKSFQILLGITFIAISIHRLMVVYVIHCGIHENLKKKVLLSIKICITTN